MRIKYNPWTKKEIKTVLTMWEDKNKDEIAKELGRSSLQINYMATQIRRAGYKLSFKTKKGKTRGLILEAIKELR